MLVVDGGIGSSAHAFTIDASDRVVFAGTANDVSCGYARHWVVARAMP